MPLNPLDLGVQNTEELDSISAADSFLSGKTEDLQKLPPKKKEEEEKKPEEKKPEETILSTGEAADGFLDATEEEEEETETDNPLDQKKKEALKKKEEAAATTAPEESTEDEPQANEFEVISRQLIESGIFTQETEDEAIPQTAEELKDRFQAEKQKGATQWLDSFLRRNGEDRMDLFEAIFVNGQDPREYIPAYNNILNLEDLDLSQEKSQETVFREYYKRLNWAPEKIESKLQKAKDYGDLEEDSTDMHAQILQQDKAALEAKEEQKKTADLQKKQVEDQYKSSIQGVLTEALKEKELGGYPINEKSAAEIVDFLTRPAYKLPTGELLTEFDKVILESKSPSGAAIRVKLAANYLNNFDVSKIAKKAISKESSELFSGLKKTAVKSKTQKLSQPSNPWANL